MNKRTVLSFAFLVTTLSTIVSTPVVDWQKVRDAVYTLHLTLREHHGFPPELVAQCIGGVLRDSERYTREERLEIAFSFMRAYQGKAHRTIFNLIYTIPDLAQGPLGVTPLMYAAVNGHTLVVQTLLAAGAEVDARNNHRWTALMHAARKGYTLVVQALLAAGAEVDAQDGGGSTALMIAAQHGHDQVVQTLLDAGADVNARYPGVRYFLYSRTALMIAVEKGYTLVVQILLNAGAEVNAQDRNSRTALMLAAEKGYHRVVPILLNAGAVVNAQDYRGSTALMIAAENGFTLVVQTLRRHIEENES